jgi:hypothetical protein
MRSVIIFPLSLIAACAADEPVYDPADCGTPRTYQIDAVGLPTNNADAREVTLDLNGDKTVDNQLGMVAATIRGMFTGLDLDARADEHLAADTNWRVSVWNCPSDQRLIALTEGDEAPVVADLRGGLQGPLFTATGRSGRVPLGALWDGSGTGGAEFQDARIAAMRLEDPADDQLDAVLAIGFESTTSSAVIIHAMAPFIDSNLDFNREHFDKDNDGIITEQEVRDATIVKSLLAPDLRIGEELDAISFGFRIHATRVP